MNVIPDSAATTVGAMTVDAAVPLTAAPPVPPAGGAAPPRARYGRTARNAALVVPLVLVNASAVYGQAGWAWQHLVPPPLRAGYAPAAVALCLLFAATVESVGIYLAYEAHAALMEDQSSGLLRVGSYLVGGLAGGLNYWHFAGSRPNALAVTFGLLSSISPWLWSIRSRSLHRADLLDRGLIDPRSVRFTLAQRVLYPVRSFRAYRLAVWNGVNSPARARADYDTHRAGTRTPVVVVSEKSAPEVPVEADPEVPVPVGPEVPPTAEPELPPSTTPELPVSDTAEPTGTSTPPKAIGTTGTSGRRSAGTSGGTSTRRKPAVKAGTSGRTSAGTSTRRTAEETRELAAQHRAERPDISRTELARILGISTTRLRQVEAEVPRVNGSEVLTT